MKISQKIIYTLIVMLSVASCKDFDDLEKDPNRPTAVTPSLILGSVIHEMVYQPWSDQHRWNQYWCSNYNYYDNNEYNWTYGTFRYLVLNDVNRMELEAEKQGLPEINAYSVLARFFRAYYYYDMTMLMGDLPLSEALASLETPVYTSQKEIFAWILEELKTANNEANEIMDLPEASLQGDFMLGNSLAAWQKIINAFHIRVLIQLSMQEQDADLDIPTHFDEIMNLPEVFPLPESPADNLQYIFNDINKYPFNKDNFGFYATRYNTAATYLNTLTSIRDPRTFVTAEPADTMLKLGYEPTDYESFVGASSGESLDDMSYKAGIGAYSFINKARYFNTYEGEPAIQIGYAEMCFNIAEAINLGWTPGDAEEWYRNGILASMDFYGIPETGTFMATFYDKQAEAYENFPISFEFETYYAQSAVAYHGNDQTGREQILLQKYLALFQHSGWESYYNYRRTGVPEFITGPGTGNGSQIPKRWKYPLSEKNYNSVNYESALSSQTLGEDDINAVLWIIK
jgi:hypothetical protein